MNKLILLFLLTPIALYSQYVCNDCDMPLSGISQEIYLTDECNYLALYTAGECDSQCFIRIDGIVIPPDTCEYFRVQELMNLATQKILLHWLETTPCSLQQDTMRIVNLFKPVCSRIVGEKHAIVPCSSTNCCMTTFVCTRKSSDDPWKAQATFYYTQGLCSDPNYDCFFTCE